MMLAAGSVMSVVKSYAYIAHSSRSPECSMRTRCYRRGRASRITMQDIVCCTVHWTTLQLFLTGPAPFKTS
jgi:hypothetical protein